MKRWYLIHTSNKKQIKRISKKILKMDEKNNNIAHLFVVYIKFNDINPKTLLFNEIYPPIFEEIKKMEPIEWSTLQLMSIMVRNEKGDKINSFPYTSKTHSRLNDKKFSPLYAEDPYILWWIALFGLLVTSVYVTTLCNNCTLEPVYDDFTERSYIKKLH